ncbi:MAG: helicase-related protein [Roseiflexaceae bacterium]|nr:helicase-related protein [Roseiflexaceae bacterium]
MPPFIPPDFIDNNQHKLSSVLSQLITEMAQTEAAIASGYFEPNVWKLVGPALQRLQRFRLLLGRQPEIVLPQNDLVDLRRYYQQKLQGDLEHLQYNATHAQIIEELIAFLCRESVQVRLFNRTFLHAKAYIFPHYAIVGSSNFTPSGLSNNAELDLVNSMQAVARDLLHNWFEPKWVQSIDYKPDLIATLEASKFGNRPWTPYDVFMKTLYEYFRGRLTPEDEGTSGLELAEFQREGLHEAIRLLDRYDGVLVADAVGLGKTFIGLGLLEHYLIGQRRRGNIPRGLIICPAQLRTTVWEPKLRDYQIAATVLSMEEIGRQDFPWKEYRNVDFVLIDESHNFRNSATTRYRNLFRLLAAGKRHKRVALLTATPINNTIWDLYHQIMLLTRGQEDYYRDIGIGNLRSFFARVDKGNSELFDLLEATTVRRSRRDVQRRQQAGERVLINGLEVRFPERILGTITYDLDGTYAGFYSSIAHDIERLTLVSYNIEQFKRSNQEQTTIDRNSAIIGILKTLFLKRLESSIASFESTLRRQQQFQRMFYETLIKRGRLLDSATYRRISALLGSSEDGDIGDEGINNSLATLLGSLPTARAQDYDVAELERKLEADLTIFNGMIERIEIIRHRAQSGAVHDDKLEQLKRALQTAPLLGKKLLIFSYYEETARYLHDQLCQDQAWLGTVGNPSIALLTGRHDAAQRKAVIQRFAPQANNAIGINNTIDILISTDVLSEGQNLQDAGALINYDLHWNPVRMIQRAGRIDRIGSPHPILRIYNCFPEDELEQLLGLVGRLQSRIAAIGRNLGNDASILGEVVNEKSLDDLRRLRMRDQTILAKLEDEEEALFSGDDMRLPLIAYIQQIGESVISEIPMGIHSGRGNQQLDGIFFAFRSHDRYFWRFYETMDGALKTPAISDRRQLFQMLACPPSEPRMVPHHTIWTYLEQATRHVLTDIQRQQGTQRLRPPMAGTNLKLYHALAVDNGRLINTKGRAIGDNPERQQLIQQLMAMLQSTPLRPFERDSELRRLQQTYQETNDLDTLIADLDTFAVEHELYSDVATERPSTFAGITAEDVELVCYEIFSRS